MRSFRRRTVLFSYLTLSVFVYELAFPAAAYALTGGPSTPEVQSFEPIGTSDMVDMFSGDFKYNIPLMEVDGYPVNISYNGGINMDQEASWVGLGWNLNPGTVNRNLRGIPDDFMGDEIEKKIKLKDNVTIGGSFERDFELFGKATRKKKGKPATTGNNTKDKLSGRFSYSLGLNYNNYTGLGVEMSAGINSSLGKAGGSALTAGLNLSYSGSSGIALSPNLSFDYKRKTNEDRVQGINVSASGSVNSRSGMKQLNFGWNANLSGLQHANQEKKAANQKEGPGGMRFAGGGSSILLGNQTFTPSISVPMNNISISLTYKWGTEIKGVTNPNNTVNGYLSIQSLREPIITKHAYGYMHLEKAGQDDMMDFNREKDGPVSETSTNLAIPVATYDIYTVTGHGIGGSFRLYRNDNVYMREETNSNLNSSVGAAVDIAFADKFKVGINLSFVQNKSQTSNIHDGNHLQGRARYVKSEDLPANPLYEPVYFRQMGEPTRSNVETHSALMRYAMLSPITSYDYVSPQYTAHIGRFEPYSLKALKTLSSDPLTNVQTERQPRNTVMQALTAYQADRFGLSRKISYYSLASYTPESGTLTPGVSFSREGGHRKAHHISEIRVYSTDGTRYVYGLPAYNIVQEEVSFATGNNSTTSGNCATGLVNYSEGNGDIEIGKDGNDRGIDHFVQRVKTPAYVYAHHLTGILSQDYVDVRGDGITDDDLGTAIKFDYQLIDSTYKWRTPYGEHTAMYNEGRKTDFSDDRGSIIYGEKEVYVLHSIVGKNHIAIFYVSGRADGLGVQDIHGGQGGTGMYQLDSIVLYNKKDFYENGAAAYKIKATHFEYDYTLCGGIDNYLGDSHLDAGKLTLKKIWFTYGNSFKGKLSPYLFDYNGESDDDYDYHIKGHDRWGTFLHPGSSDCGDDNVLSTAEFPFTPQVKGIADEYAGVWSLKQITLPSGGIIEIDYEADDYAYVQDKRAMTMQKIAGFWNSDDYTKRSDLLYIKEGGDFINNYVFFDLNGPTTQDQLDQMVKGIETLQFTVFVDINGKGQNEFVKGYAEVDIGSNYYGLVNGDSSAFIRLKMVTLKDEERGGDANPISMNVWNWSRIHATDLVYGQKPTNNTNTNKAIKPLFEIVGMFNEMLAMVQGINGNLKMRSFGQKVKLAKSFLRLNAKGSRKLGGGHRVKRIQVNDIWSEIGSANTTATDFKYGQEYFYETTEEGEDGIARTISSGVASFEPSIGSDENPFTFPRVTTPELALVPDIQYMDDAPIGESFMPSAQVGYSKVTMKALTHAGVKKTATGKQVYEFYTSKDFPFRVEETAIKFNMLKPSFLESFFTLTRLDETKVTASQGYKIEVNDMHGKPKAEYTYSESSTDPIGGVKYDYLTQVGEPTALSNRVKVVSPSGAITEKELATEVEVQSDYRQSYNEVTSASISANTDFFTIGAFPLLIPSIYPGYKKSTQKVQTVVTAKVVSRYGILHKTTAIKEGSQIVTENLLYDEITGSVLVSSVQNEFDNNIYSVTTPAHWAYDKGMGPAYKNISMRISDVYLYTDTIIFPNGLNVRNYLVPGDLVLVEDQWNKSVEICHVYEGEDSRLNLILERNGEYFFHSFGHRYTLEVIRPARRNMQAVPIQQMTLAKNPLTGGMLTIDSVISASAVEYSDYWPFYCDKNYKFTCDTINTLPLPQLFTFFNDIFNEINVGYTGLDIDKECVLTKLEGYGYKNTSLDSLFTRSGGSYTLVGATAGCLSCSDSLFIKLAEGVYQGFDFIELTSCREETQAACTTAYGTILSDVPYNTLYETFRALLEDLAANCYADTALRATLATGSPFQNNGDVVFNFGRCDEDCQVRIEMPNGYCYRRIDEALDIKYHSNDKFEVELRVELPDGTFDTLTTTGFASCVALRIIDCEMECETPEESTVLNPYRTGILGNWRMKKQLAFVENRMYASEPRPATDGIYANFTPYWAYNSGQGKTIPSTSDKWIWASRVSKYSPHGNEIENEDALGRYSSALFGFNYTLPIAVAGNSKYEQLAYESFEENSNFWVAANCNRSHFQFNTVISVEAEVTDEYAHSGNYSLKVNGSETINSENERTFCAEPTNAMGSMQMEWESCYCVGQFNPDTGHYVLSGWLKEGTDHTDTAYLNASIQVKLHKTGSVVETYTLKGKGQIIEGWQRVFGEFRISDSVEMVEIILVAGTVDSWFDDVRVHPFNSNMKTYAYDQITLRLMAELDENNFATYYEYDQEGALIRVKKETVKGIQTLKEIRKSIRK